MQQIAYNSTPVWTGRRGATYLRTKLMVEPERVSALLGLEPVSSWGVG
jgi:hypothetical protein